MPCANGAGAVLGSRLYVFGGTESPGATHAMHTFLSLDLSEPSDRRKWKILEPWPGPERIQPVAAVQGNSLYLVGGIRLESDDEGKPRRTTPFLTDAFRFTPSPDHAGGSWEQIADVPRSTAAAPSPAMTLNDSQFAIFGGTDHVANQLPPATHPGFSRGVMIYDIASGKWTNAEEMPAGMSRVTAPGVVWDKDYVIVSGERALGRRSPDLINVRITTEK
jgi:N-acetylneuraminic acid mutarotase